MPKTTKPPAKPSPEANGTAAPEVLTLAEAAAWLRVSAQGLEADAVAGRLPARLVAGEWRFNLPALRQWFSEAGPTAEKPSKDRMLAVFGAWKDFGEDPEAMVKEMKQARRAASATKE
jgi:hypothetical protein